MIETRRFKRFNLPLPVRLETMESEREEILDLVVRDISYTGTFIPSLRIFPVGTKLKLDFIHPSDIRKEFKDTETIKNCAGKVVRSEYYGIAIKFNEECKIESLKAFKMQ
jgi:hypothetical protein